MGQEVAHLKVTTRVTTRVFKVSVAVFCMFPNLQQAPTHTGGSLGPIQGESQILESGQNTIKSRNNYTTSRNVRPTPPSSVISRWWRTLVRHLYAACVRHRSLEITEEG